MPIGTSVAIVATTRILSPLISDLYKSAKGAAALGLNRWQETNFPRRLVRRINSLAQVKTLWSPDDDVSLLSFYYPPSFVIRKAKGPGQRKSVESVRELGEGNIVIQGIVGQGKSIFLRYLAIKDATSAAQNRLPIFLEFRTLHPGFTLMPAIYKTLSAYDINVDDDTFDHLGKSGRILLLLDAFDELDEALVKTTLTDIDHLGQKYPELQIIVTSRPGNEIQKANGFRTMRIMPLREIDYGPFLTKLGLSQTKIFEIKEAIRESPGRFTELITTPLMLTLVVIVYESEKEIPPTLPEFFERLFQVVFTRHDRLKAGFNRKLYSGLSERRLQNLFEAFCFMTLQNGFGRSLSSEQFSTAFDQALEYTENCKCEEEKFKLDMVKVACLMLEEGIDTTTFLHKSVLEYYAAAFIKHSSDEVAKLFYQAVDDNYRTWQEVIRFLADIDPYRYSKEYAINELKNIRSELIEPLKKRTDAVLLKTLNKIYPSFSVSYSRIGDDGDEFISMSYGTFETQPRPLCEGLESLLITAADKTLPTNLSVTELENIAQRTIDEPEFDDEIEVRLNQIIEFGGSKEFWDALDIFSVRLERMEKEALATIEHQEKRKLIFQPKPRQKN